MKAVILGGGNGTRLMPLTKNKPKMLVEVAGRPILEHILDFIPQEIGEIVVVVSPRFKPLLFERFGKEFGGRKIHYVIQQSPTGTAHALSLCRDVLGEEKFLLLPGDDFQSKAALEKLIKNELAILLATHKDPRSFGVAQVDEENRILLGIEEKPEKPKSNLISTSVMVLDSRIFKYGSKKRENGEHYLPDQVTGLAKEYPVRYEITDFWKPVSYPEDVTALEKIFKYEK
ncbi:MAG: hypothetical protein COU09_02165 [Candidatus Harrisonbacteria bacterium CG10_big_fil_rev_8_21_14_0_10_44_23]|uniref:Nucleotidyl transferase domain-containing protein n=1 Tax=Candidatus Harrisonbacteria bacterium CG10_big_fil_rev_8_21_14_0_10_44_23 TaxID=1974585 RepID=A0A2H0US20_9BACT|nr:MAG: hypothetical protein COU09_02165 [Candidatus Harrisonbacteria bacterium CG10_big_fil_rev_8_21_14_0_10_44_23]